MSGSASSGGGTLGCFTGAAKTLDDDAACCGLTNGSTSLPPAARGGAAWGVAAGCCFAATNGKGSLRKGERTGSVVSSQDDCVCALETNGSGALLAVGWPVCRIVCSSSTGMSNSVASFRPRAADRLVGSFVRAGATAANAGGSSARGGRFVPPNGRPFMRPSPGELSRAGETIAGDAATTPGARISPDGASDTSVGDDTRGASGRYCAARGDKRATGAFGALPLGLTRVCPSSEATALRAACSKSW